MGKYLLKSFQKSCIIIIYCKIPIKSIYKYSSKFLVGATTIVTASVSEYISLKAVAEDIEPEQNLSYEPPYYKPVKHKFQKNGKKS